jgi:hypothetical protein
VKGLPQRNAVCHCTFCQRRTGSAFGVNIYFGKDDFELVRGHLAAYEHRSDESGGWLRMEFCPKCGTTVSWTLEVNPALRGIAAGTFDDTSWVAIERHGWTRSKQHWVEIPAGAAVFEKSSLR